MARSKSDDDQYSGDEAERRLAAALRGSRITGHKQMTDIPKKRVATVKRRAARKRNKKDA